MHVVTELWEAKTLGLFRHSDLVRAYLDDGLSCQSCLDEFNRFIFNLEPEVEESTEEARGDVGSWIAELSGLPEDERLGKIKRARKRFQGLPFVRALLDEVEESDRLDDAQVWAACAIKAGERTSGPAIKPLLVLAHSQAAELALQESDLQSARFHVKSAHWNLDGHFMDLRHEPEDVRRIDSAILARLYLETGRLSVSLGAFSRAARQLLAARAVFALLEKDEDVRMVEEEFEEARMQAEKSRHVYKPVEHCLSMLVPEEKADA